MKKSHTPENEAKDSCRELKTQGWNVSGQGVLDQIGKICGRMEKLTKYTVAYDGDI